MTRRVRLVREIALLVAALGALAVAAFVAQKLFLSRRVPAPNLPQSLDAALKPLMLRQVKATENVVEDPRVTAAFAAILDRLIPALSQVSSPSLDAPGKLDVLVVDSPIINAFALPGGVVCVYSGLVRAVESAEEMAAILGHELSHVANRDPLSLLARQVGLSTLASLASGGQGETIAQGLVLTIVNARYTNEAEDRADRFAVDLLAAAGISPDSFGTALKRIRDTAPKHAKLLRYIDPHSPIDRRIGRADERSRSLVMERTDGFRALEIDWKLVIESLPPREEGQEEGSD